MKYNCRGCGKKFIDRQQTIRRVVKGEKNVFIENEFVQLCNKCGKKWIHIEKKKAWLGSLVAQNLITKEELQQYTHQKMCERDLFMLAQKRKNEGEKINFEL